MAVTETPPEIVAAASGAAPTPALGPSAPTGLAGVLGTGDHKVIGRLYIVAAIVCGVFVVALGEAFAIERIGDGRQVFSSETVFQFFTLWRVAMVFLMVFPLVIGTAMVVVPLQVGARSIAFPRAAATSFWGWLMGAVLLFASYAQNGGPGGGDQTGVTLWIAAMGLLIVSILVAAICLATTVLALRSTGLSLSRVPLFAWSVAVAAVMWLVTLPVLAGLLVVMYVDIRHGGSTFGGNAAIYPRILWAFRNPQVYVLAVPVLGFAADVLATTARTRIAPRVVAQGAIAAFGVLGFGAFLAGSASDPAVYDTLALILISAAAVLPVLAVLGLAGDLFRRGSFRLTAGALYAVSAMLVLLVGVLGGVVGSVPALETANTIYDLGVTHAVVLAAVIAALGSLHWWATKVGYQPAGEGLGRVAPILLLVGALLTALPDMVSSLAGDATEKSQDWTGGIQALDLVSAVGIAIVALGLLVALASLRPLLEKTDDDIPADPWEGQSLEWLAPSPPPLANFVVDVPVVTSAEPLLDQREES